MGGVSLSTSRLPGPCFVVFCERELCVWYRGTSLDSLQCEDRCMGDGRSIVIKGEGEKDIHFN